MRTEESIEQGIVAAYRANKTIPAIEQEFGIGRTTIYHVLRRNGQLPQRTARRMEGASKDAAIAGLYELIAYQDRQIEERDKTIASLTRKLRAAERKGKPTTGTVASKRKAAG